MTDVCGLPVAYIIGSLVLVINLPQLLFFLSMLSYKKTITFLHLIINSDKLSTDSFSVSSLFLRIGMCAKDCG